MQKCLASTYVYWEDGAFEMLPPDKRVEKVTTTIIICLEMHKHVGVSCKYFNLKTLLAFWSWSWSLVEREERGLTWCASSDSFTLPFVGFFFLTFYSVWVQLDVIKLDVDTCACTVGLLKQDQRWRSAVSLSQQSACPRFYLRIRSSLLYLTAEVGRPLLLHDGSCRPLEAERCSFQNWLKSVPLFTKKRNNVVCFVH